MIDSVNNDKVMGTVKGLLVLRMVGLVCAVADIKEASLVDAAVGLAQPIDDILRLHDVGKGKAILG